MQASKMNLRREFIKEYIQNVYNSVVRHMDPSTKKKKGGQLWTNALQKNICRLIDSCWYLAETNTALQSNYPS